ncbi:hypothetical protein BSKO_12301 [Bryopsis sp. KO-2023]|nr:hypothetical protein BSKO_12301 [Bryopsis sp. KO-2023]
MNKTHSMPTEVLLGYRPTSFPLVPYRSNSLFRRQRSPRDGMTCTQFLQRIFGERFSDSDSCGKSPKGSMKRDGVSIKPEGLLKRMRKAGNKWKQGKISLVLAESNRHCWGVERAIEIATEALASRGGKLHLTSEIAQGGAAVDVEGGYQLVPSTNDGRDFSSVRPGDIVLLPAHGSTAQELIAIKSRGGEVFSAVCPWILDDSVSVGFTTVIHGSLGPNATAPPGNYLTLSSLEDAQYLGNYILSGGAREEFMNTFRGASSPGFDPEKMLGSIAFTSQTESEHQKEEAGEAGDVLRAAMIEKHGIDRMDDHFMSLDEECHDLGDIAVLDKKPSWTPFAYEQNFNREQIGKKIPCLSRTSFGMSLDGSTSESSNMPSNQKLDMIIIVGDFESEKAKHLQKIAQMANITSYWVDLPEKIDVKKNAITWQNAKMQCGTTFGFLPRGETLIGVMPAGGTPDDLVENVFGRIFDIQNQDF